MHPYDNGQRLEVYRCGGIFVSSSPTMQPTPGQVNYDPIKNALINPSPEVSQELKQAVQEAPSEKVGVSSNPSPSSVPAPVQPAINEQQLNDFYKANAARVANYNTTNITNNSTIQDIARGQAATEAAKQMAESQPKTIKFTGSADLPDVNQYDPEVTQPEEQNFVNKVHSFLNSGLPVLSAIRSSGLSASGSPTMNATIWGNPVAIDFSGQQTPLRAAGSVLVMISLILAYLIVVRS